MNTGIELIIFGNSTDSERLEEAGLEIENLFARSEAIMSRFREDSELSRLNRDRQIENASPILYRAVKEAIKMADLTEGIFDPTILDALEKAGYDRSFERINSGTGLTRSIVPSFLVAGSYRNIRLDDATRSISLPWGLRVDLGGIGKGLTVDNAARFLKLNGFRDFLVSAGGDMYLSGEVPESQDGWVVAVQNPLRPDEDITELTARDCGLATSSVTKRRWMAGGQLRNHLIDPRTGLPVVNNLASVTVIAPSTQMADVLAKTALILGYQEGRAFIERQAGCSALFVTQEEEILR